MKPQIQTLVLQRKKGKEERKKAREGGREGERAEGREGRS
jgi:hypothetical protein